MYEKKPRSRVFAPLAETYRKLGMLDDAFKILQKGIKNHPGYTLGYIVLSHCYYDIQNYEMAYNTIRPFVSQNLENITLQKLFAKICINLGYLEEALETFKYLLLINPKDEYVAEQVKLLEDDLLIQDIDDSVETKNLDSSFDEDEWVQVDFNASKSIEKQTDNSQVDFQDWVMEKSENPLESFKKEVSDEHIKINHHKLDDDYFHEDYDNESSDVILPLEENEEESQAKPIITHTLVDLYIKQGHLGKAANILESILELHPNDLVTQQKLDEVTVLLAQETLGVTSDKLQFGAQEEQAEDELEFGAQEEQAELEISPIENKKTQAKDKLGRLKKKFVLYQKTLTNISKNKLSTI